MEGIECQMYVEILKFSQSKASLPSGCCKQLFSIYYLAQITPKHSAKARGTSQFHPYFLASVLFSPGVAREAKPLWPWGQISGHWGVGRTEGAQMTITAHMDQAGPQHRHFSFQRDLEKCQICAQHISICSLLLI